MNNNHKNFYRIKGHLIRRIIHISLGIVPLLYYWYGEPIAAAFSTTSSLLVICALIVIVLIEVIRIAFKIVVYGQRDYEENKISAAAWALIGSGIVLLLSPRVGNHGGGFGIPLIWSLCIADPLMGEARIMKFSARQVFVIGIISVLGIWILCAFLFSTPWWVIPIIVPITVASEFIYFSWIDDNAMMLLIPLIVLLALSMVT